MTKICSKCGIEKPLDKFYSDKSKKSGKASYCKECTKKKSKEHYREHIEESRIYNKDYHQKHKKELNKQSRKYHQEHRKERNEKQRKYYEKTGREKAGSKSMYEDKFCAQYLGIVIGERLIKHLFKDVEVMPYGNPKFDFICNKGKKIDVKTRCIALEKRKYPHWKFYINHNTIADFFILVAFDNRTDLNPLHLWMIPGKEINNQKNARISPPTIHKWDEWKIDINDAQICCTEMKENHKN